MNAPSLTKGAPPPSGTRAVLSAYERTVDGGTSLTTWLYFDGAQWRAIKDHPEGKFTRSDCGPGVLWETVAEVRLPLGTWLQRIDRFPNQTQHSRDPMDYLRRQVRTRQYTTRRSYFTLHAGGRLRRAARQEAPD